MGDWAQGEFQVAEQVAGEDYTCLPGLGVNEIISTAGDAFYFPKLDDPEKTKAQLELASLMLSKDCLLYTSPSPRDGLLSRMPSSA